MLTTSDSDSPAARSRTKDKYIFWLGYGSGSERPLFSQSKQPVPRVPTTRHFTSARIKLLTVQWEGSVLSPSSSFYLYLIYQVLLFLFWTMIKEIENENGRYILTLETWSPRWENICDCHIQLLPPQSESHSSRRDMYIIILYYLFISYICHR